MRPKMACCTPELELTSNYWEAIKEPTPRLIALVLTQADRVNRKQVRHPRPS